MNDVVSDVVNSVISYIGLTLAGPTAMDHAA
jgi:hypothetical protein